MKKIVSAICGSLLAAALLLSMVACGGKGGGNDLIDSEANTAVAYSKQDLTDLAGWTMNGTLDDLGYCVLRKTDSATRETSYMLYNVVTAEKQTSSEAFSQISSGLYYTESMNQDETAYTFTYYGKGGSAKTYTVSTNTQDIPAMQTELENAREGMFADDTYLYVTVKGEIATGTNNLTPVLTYAEKENAYRVGAYYLVIGGLSSISMAQVFDENGAYVKSYNVYQALDVPADATFAAWYVGEKAFIQAAYGATGDSSYDYINDGLKYKTVTYSYDPAEDKFEKVDCPFVVEYMIGVSPYSDEYAAVTGWEIGKDKSLLAAKVVQTLGADGKYWTDLQELLPGTSNYLIEESSYILINSEKAVVYEANKEVGSFANDDLLESYSKGVFKKGGAYYNLAGETLLRPTADQMSDITLNGKIYYQTRNEETNELTLHIFDAATKAETTEKIATISYGVNSVAYYLTVAGEEEKTYSMKLLGTDLTVFEGKALASTNIGVSVYKDGNTQYGLVGVTLKGETENTTEYYLVKAENLPNTLG